MALCGGSCSGTVLINVTNGSTTSGTFTDGSDAASEYDSDRRCNFLIKAPPNKRVVLSFNRLDTEDGYDFVYAFDSGYDGRAVQVEPMKLMLKLLGTERLTLQCDVLLSTSAFKFNLRRYTTARPAPRIRSCPPRGCMTSFG